MPGAKEAHGVVLVPAQPQGAIEAVHGVQFLSINGIDADLWPLARGRPATAQAQFPCRMHRDQVSLRRRFVSAAMARVLVGVNR
jgi:hypothetical protein